MHFSPPPGVSVAPQPGAAETLLPDLRRVVAGNASRFTRFGTNTYIVGEGEVAIVDPGPNLGEHVDAVVQALAGKRVVAIVLTHTHRDHSGACDAIKSATGAPTYAFGPHLCAMKPRGLAVIPRAGWDLAFRPDHTLADGQSVAGPGWTLEAVHTPGHASNHICLAFRERNVLLSGDQVMGWSSSTVTPPDGDIGSYMASLEKLLARGERAYYPGHGESVEDPRTRVLQLLERRRQRRDEIRGRLVHGDTTISVIADALYSAMEPNGRELAHQMIFAHLLDLEDQGLARFLGPAGLGTAVIATEPEVRATQHGDRD